MPEKDHRLSKYLLKGDERGQLYIECSSMEPSLRSCLLDSRCGITEQGSARKAE